MNHSDTDLTQNSRKNPSSHMDIIISPNIQKQLAVVAFIALTVLTLE